MFRTIYTFFVVLACYLSVFQLYGRDASTADSTSETHTLVSFSCLSATSDSLAYEMTQMSDSVSSLPFYRKGVIGKVYNYFANSNHQRTRNFDMSFIGGPHYSTEEGFGLGVAASGIYSAGGLLDTVTPLSNITLKLDATTGQMFKVGVEGYHIFVHDRYRINYSAMFYSFKDKWWGIGYNENRADSNECKYSRLQARVQADFVFQLRQGVFLGPIATLDYINARDFAIPSLLRGEDKRTLNLGVGLTFLIDTRDIPTAASSGLCLRLNALSHPGFLANSMSFTLAEASFSYYHKVWKGAVLAANLHGRFTWGDTPWGLLSSFGGSSRMRGYWEGRYRDKMETDLTVELRQNIWGRSGAVVWLGAGTVYPEFSAFRFKQILPNAGVGYRWEFKKGVNVRLDLGFGKGESGFNFSLNEAF